MSLPLANLLFNKNLRTFNSYNETYPNRNNSAVTRIAPSPTGKLHLGVLYTALINRMVAYNGVFYLRIEDTDKKREVEGAIDDIISGLKAFGIKIDEGYNFGGDYAPYKQSERVEIYHSACKWLAEQGLAYPCFCLPEELEKQREMQQAQKLKIGYKQEFAKCRNLTIDEIKQNLAGGKPYVLRFKSNGDEENKIKVKDLVRGELELSENDLDFVLLKSDGVPTYHLAHVVDDFLMRTTHVIRGDEWLSSLPIHLQLFHALELKPPKYAHISPIMVSDNGSKRKLSKRKDEVAAVSYFLQKGFHPPAVIEYLLTIASSGFEGWRKGNQAANPFEFALDLRKMSVSGALFDLDKLIDISRTIIAKMTAEEVLENMLEWAKIYDKNLFERLNTDKAKAIEIFEIDRGGKNPRRDIAVWGDVAEFISMFYDDSFKPDYTLPENIKPEDAAQILQEYAKTFELNCEKQQWFENLKSIAEKFGFSPDVKAYKQNPNEFKGHVGDVAGILRIAICGKPQAPDLFSVMQILGEIEVCKRLERATIYYEGAR